MQYLAWRVMAGLNESIEISFMLVGHTKFAPDWAFGLLKQKFRRTLVGCLDDMAKVVSDSATINHPQLVGRENGEIIVPQYDWAKFFDPYFRRLGFEGIKSLHHLCFSSHTEPGKVNVRNASDSKVQTLKVLRKSQLNWQPSPDDMPDQIIPPGLSQERKKYLFEKIREFVPEESRDIVCPNPEDIPSSTAHSSSSHSSLQSPPESLSQTPPPSPSPPPPPKRKRRRRY